jgi:hypothetical protein
VDKMGKFYDNVEKNTREGLTKFFKEQGLSQKEIDEVFKQYTPMELASVKFEIEITE